jgi:flagellar basal body-associated protein FliL
MAQKNTKKQKMTNAQREGKMKAAEERQKRADEMKAAKERTKKIFTWIIVIILVIGLTLPVAGLSAAGCMSQDAANTATEQTQDAGAADASESTAEASSSSSNG